MSSLAPAFDMSRPAFARLDICISYSSATPHEDWIPTLISVLLNKLQRLQSWRHSVHLPVSISVTYSYVPATLHSSNNWISACGPVPAHSITIIYMSPSCFQRLFTITQKSLCHPWWMKANRDFQKALNYGHFHNTQYSISWFSNRLIMPLPMYVKRDK